MITDPTPRQVHYGQFYNLPVAQPLDGRPLLIVHGNCQAESLRVLFELRYPELQTVRMVPAHELTADDLPYLDRLLSRAAYLITQPIRDNYRDLPLGSAQLIARAPHATVGRLPVLYWRGLHPAQVNVRTPAGDPPIVPYQDLRTIAQALGHRRPRVTREFAAQTQAESRAELARRTAACGGIDVVDVITRRGQRTMHVINHPDNPVLQAAVSALAHQVGLPTRDELDPGRVLLRSVIAPVPEQAALAHDLTPQDETYWQVDGVPVAAAEIEAAHLEWYAKHPEVVDFATQKFGTQLRDLLATGGQA